MTNPEDGAKGRDFQQMVSKVKDFTEELMKENERPRR